MRIATITEIASVVLSVMIAVWIVVPLAPGRRWLFAIPALSAFALIVYSLRIRGESLESIGLGASHFVESLRLITIPTAIAVGLLLLIGWSNSSIRFDGNLPFKLVSLPLWGLLQQFILQSFIYRRIRMITRSRALALICASALFALVHLPNPTLTVLTFIGAIVWSSVFERAPNIYPLAVSHALASLTVMSTLPTSMLRSLSVGYKYFFFQ